MEMYWVYKPNCWKWAKACARCFAELTFLGETVDIQVKSQTLEVILTRYHMLLCELPIDHSKFLWNVSVILYSLVTNEFQNMLPFAYKIYAKFHKEFKRVITIFR